MDEDNNTKKVIDDWMEFVDGHVDSISKKKTEISQSLDKLGEEDLSRVATGLQTSQNKMKEAENALNDVWTSIPK